MSEVETRFSVQSGMGLITLNRPKVLNALSWPQYLALTQCLTDWESDDRVRVVVLEGEGERAFCAGGDIRMVWDARQRGDHALNRDIFRTEYRLNRRIHHYPKPIVSLLDGIVMGGGAGLSINGCWRVATERTQFAMPETGIGFFPDVGATYFLGRLPGSLGLYLGLTGTRLGPGDCLHAGIATHFIAADQLDSVKTALMTGESVTDVLDRFQQPQSPGEVSARQAEIDRCFGKQTLADIFAALATEGSPWALSTLEELVRRSPTSLAVTFRQLTAGQSLSFDDAIRQEFRLACRFLDAHDFYEGIRALVVDKDKSPHWQPGRGGEVSEAVVAGYFQPLLADELPLP
ncbi:Enoyl-CoA hydratase/carnithine racemase [Candidatus Terasakiella magnetica]|nr:Enoyl-CoA hydratase/carnithine racemase [Candidatus Terasakiella magnetica]